MAHSPICQRTAGITLREAASTGNRHGQEMQGVAGAPSSEQGPDVVPPTPSGHTAALSVIDDHATAAATMRLNQDRTSGT